MDYEKVMDPKKYEKKPVSTEYKNAHDTTTVNRIRNSSGSTLPSWSQI